MPRFEIDLDPVQHITADAIGEPGQRVFYLQAWRESDVQPITIIIEKVQLQTLAAGIDQMLSEVAKQNAAREVPAKEFDEEKMHITPPVDPLFRGGEMGLGYDADRDLIVILAREIVAEGGDAEEASVVRFWCNRQQASALASWSDEVVNRGRPICPLCGQPMDPAGHFCPKKNGHKH
jgi:uncharacterized repeat protein (TIGR03847 family)